ncbi:IclR family transcriptional regulator [Luteococcus sp. H138]|uniref:IclR family transcriptional regulator n=1 Tax=unclassified Luteococcus TaxID=2639923 RepID=UPI00313D6B79
MSVDTPAPEAHPPRSVASKVLDILGAFETARPSLSLTEIAQACDLPLPTAHRLVGELVTGGALLRLPNGNYSVSLLLWTIGENSLRRARGAARLHLQDLFALTQETAQMAVRAGDDALYLERVYSSKRVPRASRVGGRLPLHLTAVGKVLLAYESPTFIEHYLGLELEGRTRHSRTDAEQLRVELAKAKERGFATTQEEVRLGSCSIAVPVTPRHGLMPAAVGLVMNVTQASSMRTHLPALRGVAEQLGNLTEL